jgi:TatD DNase family protein
MSHALIDIGANLTHDSFDSDRDEVIARARAVGVDYFILTGSSEAASQDALELARQHPDCMRSTAGVHPHHASDYCARVEATLERLLEDPLTVAVGECGLDYFRNFSPVDTQRHAFEKQLELAVRVGKPIFLHQRDAHDDFVAMLEPFLADIPRAVAHCFTGDADMLDTYLDMGLYIGITGWICDERRGSQLQEVVGRIPLDRLMIETDAPYLLPRSLRPKPKTRRNEPLFLPEVLRVVAESYGESPSRIAEATTATAMQFFGLGD